MDLFYEIVKGPEAGKTLQKLVDALNARGEKTRRGEDEGQYNVRVTTNGLVAIAEVWTAKEPVLPSPPPPGKQVIRWTGDVPPPKWMNFYTKVLSRFASTPGLKLRVSFEAPTESDQGAPNADATKSGLKELGLENNVTLERVRNIPPLRTQGDLRSMVPVCSGFSRRHQTLWPGWCWMAPALASVPSGRERNKAATDLCEVSSAINPAGTMWPVSRPLSAWSTPAQRRAQGRRWLWNRLRIASELRPWRPRTTSG